MLAPICQEKDRQIIAIAFKRQSNKKKKQKSEDGDRRRQRHHNSLVNHSGRKTDKCGCTTFAIRLMLCVFSYLRVAKWADWLNATRGHWCYICCAARVPLTCLIRWFCASDWRIKSDSTIHKFGRRGNTKGHKKKRSASDKSKVGFDKNKKRRENQMRSSPKEECILNDVYFVNCNSVYM